MLPSSGNETARAWRYLENRFGIEREELEYSIRKASGDYWLVSEEMETDLEVETYGIRFLRTTGRGLKPTTYSLQLLEGHLDKNVVEVSKEEFLDLLHRRNMINREMEEEGYVALKYGDRILGCGFYKGEKVSSRIPKGRSKELIGVINSD